MPTYRYRCDRCGEQLEVWQSIRDESLRTHDGECGGELLKVLGVGGIVLKGSGFYRTDNRAAPKQEGDGAAPKKDTAPSNGSTDKTKKPDKPDKADKPAKAPSKSESPSA